jgi:hypothetical protein
MDKEAFEFGVRQLAETLIRLSVSNNPRHEGEVGCDEIVEAAKSFGVILNPTFTHDGVIFS